MLFRNLISPSKCFAPGMFYKEGEWEDRGNAAFCGGVQTACFSLIDFDLTSLGSHRLSTLFCCNYVFTTAVGFMFPFSS